VESRAFLSGVASAYSLFLFVDFVVDGRGRPSLHFILFGV
jgi:hypothetical protein